MSAGDTPVGRRAVLAAIGGLAGCSSVFGRPGAVSMVVAGSLNNAVENGLRPALDVPLRSAAHGSAEAARLVESGGKDPDIVSLADVALFERILEAEWVAEFATNALVVVYDPETAAGRRLAGGEPWYDVLADEAVSVGRTDPDLDPLGYRTLFLLDLATDYYDTDWDIRATVPETDQLYPETQLISQFETGGIDAAIAYRSMATQRGYDYLDLPSAIDLSDPAASDRYAETSYTLPDGTTVTGDVIRYGSTVRHESDRALDVFETHTTGAYLTEFGFTVPTDYPRYTGNVPATVAD